MPEKKREITTIGVDKPGPFTEGGKPKAGITVKQHRALEQVKKSERAGHKMVRDKPPKTSVRTWLKSKLGGRKAKRTTSRRSSRGGR